MVHLHLGAECAAAVFMLTSALDVDAMGGAAHSTDVYVQQRHNQIQVV